MFNLRSLLKLESPISIFTRLKHSKHNKKYLYRDGKLINGVIYYYPNPNVPEEPLGEPPKMFRVQRIKPMKGNPHWERRILRDLGMMEPSTFTVVKNIPEMCARLWKVKHLVKITPIKFPYGEPTADDIKNTFLKENGDCVVIKNIDQLQQRFDATEKFNQDKRILDGPTLRKDSRLRWMNPWENL